MRFFASAQPGFGPLLADEIAEAGATPSTPVPDGRSDLVAFDLRGAPPALRTAEDVFAEVASVAGRHPLRELVPRLIGPDGLERALSAYAVAVRPLRARETSRVVARAATERDFLRTQLRDAVSDRLASVRPRWRPADPADMELWIMETPDGWFSGLRLTRRSGRKEERAGSLRPSIAAAMVQLADTDGPILDPFCGSGTIVAAARDIGRAVYGCDVDASAVSVARANVRAPFAIADATAPPFAPGTFGAVVSNLPFGKRFTMEGSAEDAFTSLRHSLAPDGCAVVLTARDATIPDVFTIERRLDVELLGQPATLWKLRVA